jgi:ankyrin repeat protein
VWEWVQAKNPTSRLEPSTLKTPSPPSLVSPGLTALHHASIKGYCGICRLLLGRSANIAAKCLAGKTPLIYAAEQGDADVICMLILHIVTSRGPVRPVTNP